MNYGVDREIFFIILMICLALKTDSFSHTTKLPDVKNCIWFDIRTEPCLTYTLNVKIVLNSSYANTCLKIKGEGVTCSSRLGHFEIPNVRIQYSINYPKYLEPSKSG